LKIVIDCKQSSLSSKLEKESSVHNEDDENNPLDAENNPLDDENNPLDDENNPLDKNSQLNVGNEIELALQRVNMILQREYDDDDVDNNKELDNEFEEVA